MPNWCQNQVTVSGDEKKVKEFIKFVSSKKSKFDFNKIYPMPKELEGTVSGSESLKPDRQKENSEWWKVQYGADNWYDWRRMHWGTKWELDTAWCPPLGILEKLDWKFHFKKDRDLNIEWYYEEIGMDFKGYLEDDLEDWIE